MNELDSDTSSIPDAVAVASPTRRRPLMTGDDSDSDGEATVHPETPARAATNTRAGDDDLLSPAIPPTPRDAMVPATPSVRRMDDDHDDESDFDSVGAPLSPLLPTVHLGGNDHDDDAGDAVMNDDGLQNEPQAHIRGTDVHVPTAAATVTQFFRTFVSLERSAREQNDNNDDDSDSDDSLLGEHTPPVPPLYETRLKELLRQNNATATASAEASDVSIVSLDLDCMHLYYHNEDCQKFYYQMVAYPMELVPLIDLVLAKELERLQHQHDPENNHHQDEPLPLPRIQVRPFHLKTVANLRCLDPVRMDTLVSIKGMIVRTSPIIPDLKLAHFSCTICGDVQRVPVDRGRLAEPHRCPSCSTRQSYTLIHNQSMFADKQLAKLQETPDQVPAGQTPAAVSAFLFDQLVDRLVPGGRVEVTGVLRAQPQRVHPKVTKLKAVYQTYLDVIHVRTITGLDHDATRQPGAATAANASPAAASTNNHLHTRTWTDAQVAELRTISQRPDIYSQLTASLAPSIWEFDNVKKGILCMLFGGNHVRVNASRKNSDKNDDDDDDAWLDDENDPNTTGGGGTGDDGGGNNNSNKQTLHKRGDINILLCGDPGTSKSQLLSYVHKLTPRGVYTSGKGSSAVGLTASVVRDSETKDLVLESGALVLSDQGICCIDEFDKMSDTTRSVLHEAMEQQTVSIAKAGILATLHARTSVLASANPTESRYNPQRSVVDNIQLPPTLLSRFDLIYLILDAPNVEQDRKLAQHLVGLYYETPNVIEPPIPQAVLQDYIAYAREHIHPQLSDAASSQLIASYLELRNPSGSGGTAGRTITATPRQLESLIRLSEALAKMRYSEVVTRDDALEAVRLLRVATQAAATDPRTGRIDMDMLATGRSAADRQAKERLQMTLTELLATRKGSRLTVRDVARLLSEISSPHDQQQQQQHTNGTASPYEHQAIVDALKQLEADGVIQFPERSQTIYVRHGRS